MMRYDEIKPMESKIEHTEEELAYVIMDSGSNRFAVNDKTHFDELNENEKRVIQLLAKRYSTLKVEGIGKIGEFGSNIFHGYVNPAWIARYEMPWKQSWRDCI
jgi:hypothetical protein